MRIGAFQKFSLIDYPGKTCAIIFTTGCNFKCPFCHNRELVIPSEFPKDLPFEDILTFLKSRVGLLDAVEFTGGEPLMQKDILDYIKLLKDLGFLVKIDTNGSFPEMLDKIIPYVDYIAMDVKAPLSKYHLAIGRSINTDLIKSSIELIKRSNKDYEFRTTLFKNFVSNREDMLEIGKLINRAKAYYIQQPHFDKVLDPSFNFETYSLEEILELKKIVEPFAEVVEVR